MKSEHPRTLSRTGRPLGFCLSMLFVLCCASNVLAQAPEPVASPMIDLDKTTAFRPLFDEREKLQDELQNLDNEIADLEGKLRIARKPDAIERDITEWKKQIEDEKKKKTPDQEQITSYESYVATLAEELETAKSGPKIKEQRDERTQKKQRLSQVEQKIATLSDDKQNQNTFRMISTGAFSALVAVVVGGFYLIAWFKDGIAAKIFSGEMGMQFVTLFLIVIAIILFGIMGTLEGRELAALLGGLSGYILGKASAKIGGNDSESNSGGQNQQQQNQHQQQQQNPG